jgi:fatty acid desaturase|tara:strand:+ start:172 stop:1176 length:1005 start_codon:yes stop_codon:yes gene_type:complete
MKPLEYNRKNIMSGIPNVRELENLNFTKPAFDLTIIYMQILVFVYFSILFTYELSIFFYIPGVFLIAGRQGALLQLIHEASHKLISKNNKLNDFFGEFLTSLLVGVNFFGYRSVHNQHHTYTATPEESSSDSDKYVIVDFKNPKIYILFLRDIIGISAIKIFFAYSPDKNKSNKREIKTKIFFLIKLCCVQIVILSLFKFDILNYILFWLYPAIGPHMFLMRIRGIAEHGLGKKMGYKITKPSEGLYFTRSFLTKENKYKTPLLTSIEKLLIGSLNVNYHHEHHLTPRVPYYNLNKVHQYVSPNIKKEVYAKIYEKGYFSAAFSTVRVPPEELL